MKLRKVLSSVVAGALAVSAMAISVSAEADVIDFEDGAFTGISMKTDDGGDKSVLSVVDYNGSKQLKVDIQDKAKAPKIYFDLDEIYGANLSKVDTITFDFTIQSAEGDEDSGFEAPGWGGGAIGIQASGANVAWNQQDWTLEEYTEGSATTTLKRTKINIADPCDDAHMLVMRWAATVDYDIYIDNVVALDASGSTVPAYGAPAEEVADDEAEADDDAAADDEAEADDTADDEAEAEDDAAADDEADADEDDADEDDAEADEDDADEDEDADDEDEAPAVTTTVATEPAPEVTTAAATAPAAGDVAAATDSSKGSPDTGVADVAAVAGLAIVAGGAVLVAKKRK